MVVEAESVVLLGFLVERNDAAVRMKPESELLLRRSTLAMKAPERRDLSTLNAASNVMCWRMSRLSGSQRYISSTTGLLSRSGAAFFSVIQLM